LQNSLTIDALTLHSLPVMEGLAVSVPVHLRCGFCGLRAKMRS
jgi:hypothetical protein